MSCKRSVLCFTLKWHEANYYCHDQFSTLEYRSDNDRDFLSYFQDGVSSKLTINLDALTLRNRGINGILRFK